MFIPCVGSVYPVSDIHAACVNVYGLLPLPSPTLMTSRNFRSALSDTCVSLQNHTRLIVSEILQHLDFANFCQIYWKFHWNFLQTVNNFGLILLRLSRLLQENSISIHQYPQNAERVLACSPSEHVFRMNADAKRQGLQHDMRRCFVAV